MAIWREYFENAYIACFHYLVNKKLHWSERVFWLIIIITSVLASYYVISRTLNDFAEQTVIFRADTNYLDWDTPFPSVIICERTQSNVVTVSNTILNKVMQEFGYTKSSGGDMDRDLKSRFSDIAFLRPSDVVAIKDYCKKNSCPTGNFSYIMTQLRNKCTNIFAYCQYNKKVFQCCDEFLPVDTAFGKCFAFNNNGGKKVDGTLTKTPTWHITRNPGQNQGILYVEFKIKLLILHVMDNAELPHMKNEKKIFKQTQVTTLLDGYEYYYRVNVNPTVTMDDQKVVPIEIRGCRYPLENNLKYFEFYSESNCIMNCFMEEQMRLCGCLLYTYPAPSSLHCELDKIFCTTKITNNLTCICMPDCNSTLLQKVGIIQKPTKGFLYGSSKISFKVEVPAPTLRYIRYSLKTQLNITVAVGGTIGFFLGLSFLSIAQLFYYLFVRSATDYVRLKRERKLLEKEAKMKENFRIGRMRLKAEVVEEVIKKDLQKKLSEID